MSNVIPIKPTVGMSRIEQLRAFAEWEQSAAPEKTHIATWAIYEIDRLRTALLHIEQEPINAEYMARAALDYVVPNA